MSLSSVKKHAVVVVGGGVSGLYTAAKLVKGGVNDVKVYESRPMLGGRVRTTRDKDGKPLFNDFAWRVGANNTRMLALAKELGIELEEQFTPNQGSPADGHASEPKAGKAPLSVFATNALESGTGAADQKDRESGYAGRGAQVSFPHESHAAKNYVCKNGMNEYVNAIAALLPEDVVQVKHRCLDVRKNEAPGQDGYTVDLAKQEANGEWKVFSVQASTVVLAAPPFSLRQFSVAKQGLNPALFAVHERRLGHIYAKCAADSDQKAPDTSQGENRIYRSVPDNILQQVISGDYGNSIFQAGYACDRFERVWREVGYQGPDALRQEVIKQLDKLATTVLPEVKGLNIEEIFLRIGFVHRWHIEAHVSGKTKEQLSAQAIYPNAGFLPNLHLVGEAFSAHQGWTEGALQTAEDCAEIILNGMDSDSSSPHSKLVTADLNDKSHKLMQYHGVVMDVSDWPACHPGGAGPIRGMTGKDVTDVVENFHGGWPPVLATIFGLQTGTKAK